MQNTKGHTESEHKTMKCIKIQNYNKFSCRRDRAMLCVTEYFAKSLEITQGHSK